MWALFALLFEGSVAHGAQLWGLGPMSNATVYGRNDFRFRYRAMNRLEPGFEDTNPRLHDYIEQFERLNVIFNKENTVIGAQIDQVGMYMNKYMLNDELMYSWNLYDDSIQTLYPGFLVVPEKVFVRQKMGALEVSAGDVYDTFGRGIALSIFKNTAIDLDTSIRGAKMIYEQGPVRFNLISGVSNRQQIARLNPNYGITANRPHQISGSQLMLYGLGPFSLGVHGVIASFVRFDEVGKLPSEQYFDDHDLTIGGADLEFSLLGGDWYIEHDVFRYVAEEIALEEPVLLGNTTYASVSYYPGRAVVLLEAKTAKDSERINAFISSELWELATPPTLEYERMITEDASAAVNSNDVKAARIRVDVAVKPAVFTPYVSVMALRDEDLEGLHFNDTPETVVHGVGGWQYAQNSKTFIINTGFRQDIRDDGSRPDQLIHLDGEYSTPLFGEEGLEINVSGWQFQWGENPSSHEDFFEMQNAFVWRHGEHWDFTVYQDWSNNLQISSRGNINENLYAAGEVAWKPTNQRTLRFLAGAYKAGIRCSGGQCRSLPGFEGVEFAYQQDF